MSLFVRVNTRPRRDLARGFSYSMGCFGDSTEAHEGLSGYGISHRGVVGAVSDLDERMSVAGRRSARGRVQDPVCYVTVYRGTCVGNGPDGEELFRPSEIVASFKCRELTSAEDLVARLAALGIEDA